MPKASRCGGQAKVKNIMAKRKHKAKEPIRKKTGEATGILLKAVENSFDGFVMADLKGNITRANRAAGRIFGYAPREMTKLNLARLAAIPKNTRPVLKEVLSRRGWRGELNGVRKNGQIFRALLTASLVKDDKKYPAGMLCIFRDITGRKRAEEELRKEKQFANNIINTAQVIVLVLDTKGRIVSINPYMEKISGYRQEEVKGKDWFAIFLPKDDQAKIRKIFLRAIGHIQTQGNINPIIAKDGHEIDVEWHDHVLKNADGKIVGLLSIGMDVTERKAAEDTLRESEEKFHCITDQTSDLIAVTDDKGIITYASFASRSLFRCAPEEMCGRHFMEFLDKQSVPKALAAFQAVYEGGANAKNLELLMKRKDGSTFVGELSGEGFRHGERNERLVVIRDITDRKSAEEKLRESELKFNMLFNDNPAAMAVSSLAGKRFTDVNDAFLNTFGYSRAEVIGRTSAELGLFVHPEKQRKIAEELLSHGRIVNRELKVKCKDGRILDGLFSGEIIFNQGQKHFLTVMVDQTESKRAAEKLQESEERFRSFVENINDIIYMLKPNGTFTYISPNSQEMLGRDAREFIGQSFERFVHPDDVPACRAFLERVVTKVERASGIEYRVQHKDGAWRWHSSNGAPMKDSGGKFIGYLGVDRDITEHKRMEELIRESEEKFSKAFQTAPYAITITVAEDGKFIEVNDAFTSMTGFTREEVLSDSSIGLKLWVNEEDRRRVVAALLAGRSVAGEEHLFRTKSGQAVTGLFSAHVIKLTRGHCILSSIADITERKKAEEELAYEKNLLRTIIDNLPFRLYAKDLQHRFILCNKTVLDEMRVPSFRALIGKTDFDFYSRAMADIFFADEEKIFQTGRPLMNKEETWPLKSGGKLVSLTTKVPLRDTQTNALVGLVGINRDITERKLAEEALRKSEELYRSLFDNMLNGFAYCKMIFDQGRPHDFIYLNVNNAFETLTGLKNVVGKKASEVMPGLRESDPDVLERYGRVAMTGRPEMFEIYVKVLKMWFSVSIYSPEKEYFVAVFDVITERKQAEEELKRSNLVLKDAFEHLKHTEKRVIQHERLSALGQMASGIAHEFNNALLPIVGYSDILLHDERKLSDKLEAVKMLKLIHSAALDARSIISRMQEFARPRDEMKREPACLPELIESVVILTRPYWLEEMEAKGIFIKVNTAFHDMVPVSCNQSQLKEVFSNLIFNAVDAMPGGGDITIRGRFIKAEQAVELQVIDTGIGMTDDVLRRVFEPFFTTKGGENTGLGLSIVQSIITRHEGSVTIQSVPGKGTTIFIKLPLAKAVAYPAAIPSAPVLPCKPLKVLFVDDNELVRQLILEYLKADNHVVELASDGQEALRKFSKDRFDLIITDSAMPGMSGSQMVASIKKTRPAMPIIMLTGFGDIMKARNELPAGVDMILGKPVTQAAFREAIAGLMAKYQSEPKH